MERGLQGENVDFEFQCQRKHTKPGSCTEKSGLDDCKPFT